MSFPTSKQKIALLDIDVNTYNTIQTYLNNGFIIYSITNLAPVYNKLLIVYFDPSVQTE